MKPMDASRITAALLLTFVATAYSGCGKDQGGVTFKSGAFPTSGSTDTTRVFSSSIPSTDVSIFRFCVTRVRLQDSDNESRSDEDDEEGDDEIRFEPGLIDVSSGEEVVWGVPEIPVDFVLKRIFVKVHHDPDLCGVSYSLNFNGQTTQQDIEFKFELDPSAEIKAGDVLVLSLKEVVADLREAADSGTIASLKSRVEGVTGRGTKNP